MERKEMFNGEIAVYSNGKVFRLINGVEKELKQHNVGGYRAVCFNGVPRLVHRLVASAFIPNPLDKPQVNHIDGDKANNNASNLEWVTAQENIRHAYATGLMHKDKGNGVLTQRFSLTLPPELEEAILSMRQKEEFRRLSLSEIVRRLIEAGLKNFAEKDVG